MEHYIRTQNRVTFITLGHKKRTIDREDNNKKGCNNALGHNGQESQHYKEILNRMITYNIRIRNVI